MTQLDEKPIIVVCGGLGDQGGSVVKYLLEEDFFTIRILTRNQNSPRAKNAAARGIEIIQADYEDLDSLIRAFEGAYGVFAVTDFFECGYDREKQQGFNLVDAAKACNIQHFIWSSLEHSELNIPHFESKAEVDDYLKASGVPRTSLFLTFYYSNVFVMGFDRTPDGTYHMNWLYPTDAALPSIDVDDVGAWATAAFMDPEEWIGKDMKVCSEFITPRQYASTFEEISGHTVVMREVSYDDFMSQKDVPYPYNLWSNMKWFLDQGKRARDPNLAKRLHSRLRNWREFVISHLNVPPPPTLEIPMSVEVSVQS